MKNAKRALPLVMETLHWLALAVWLGSQAALLMLIGGQTSNPFFIRMESTVVYCGILMIGIQYLGRRRYQQDRARSIADAFRQLFTFAALMLAVYIREVLHKKMPADYSFSTFLTHSEIKYAGVQIALLVAVAALSVRLQMDPSLTPSPQPAARPNSTEQANRPPTVPSSVAKPRPSNTRKARR